MGPASGKPYQNSTKISEKLFLKPGLPNLYLQVKCNKNRFSGHSRTTGVPTTSRTNIIPQDQDKSKNNKIDPIKYNLVWTWVISEQSRIQIKSWSSNNLEK